MTSNRMRFPWMVALAAFVLYVLTVSRGVTLGSLPITAKIAGWDWLPMAHRPVTWLLTLPLHLLPADWIPIALNVFAAALAAMTLGLVARCVQLLPWDGAPDAKKPWLARMPALLAVAVCGFELSFWREATAATGEMTDIFLLVAAVRFLLEFRVVNDLRWLNLAALTWGLGMAENWVMVLTLPLFVAALVALRGMRFFQKDFVLQMTLVGLAGFSIYLLLPLVNWLEPHSPWKLIEAGKATFLPTKNIFHTLYYNFWSWHRLQTAAVLLYFLVPALPCFVHLKTQNANFSNIDLFQVWLYRGLRGALLLACVWLAFDPEVGPRAIMRKQIGVEVPLLTFDFINAIGIAFIAGNLLFAALPSQEYWRRSAFQPFSLFLQRRKAALFTGFTLLMVSGLLARNLPALLLVNRQPLSGFGELVERSLPAGGGIILGDDGLKLTVLQAVLARHGESRRWQVLNLNFFPDPKYRAAQERLFPTFWTATDGGRTLSPGETMQMLDVVCLSNRLFYLEPHDGQLLFEKFQPLPLGAVNELIFYPTDRFYGAPLSADRIAQTEKFWDGAWRGGLAEMTDPGPRPSRLDRLIKKRFALLPVRHLDTLQLRRWYSAALNDWGVALQASGQVTAAQNRFQQALALDTNNIFASGNLNCCTNLLAGKKLDLSGAANIMEQFRNIQQLEQLIRVFGEWDDPGARYILGNAWLAAGWPRQAWLEFERAGTLVPDAVPPQISLAQIYSRYRFDPEVFTIIRQLRPMVTNTPAGNALELELGRLEARTWISQTNLAQANKALNKLLESHPDDPVFAKAVFKAYLAFGDLTNALQLAEAQLAKSPDSIGALNNKAALLIQANQAAKALPVLDHALTLTNLPAIRLNRAIAYMQLNNPSAAEQDYLVLENSPVDQFSVHFGLAQVALARHDTNAAARHFNFCLSNTPVASPRGQEIRARLAALGH